MREISTLLLLLNFATFPSNLCPSLSPSLHLYLSMRDYPSIHPIQSAAPALLFSRIIGVANLTLWSGAFSHFASLSLPPSPNSSLNQNRGEKLQNNGPWDLEREERGRQRKLSVLGNENRGLVNICVFVFPEYGVV